MIQATFYLLKEFKSLSAPVSMPGVKGVVLTVMLLVSQVSGAWQSPLSEAEQTLAVGMALADPESGYHGLADGPGVKREPFNESSGHPLGVQVLLSELKEVKDTTVDSGRFVEVFLFDYTLGETKLKVVDVVHGLVVSTTRIDSVHLPLSDAEIQYARSRLLQHSGLEERVNAELSRLDNETSNSLGFSDLHSRISIRVPVARQAIDDQCRHDRCALVSLFTENDHSLSVEPVVNLSSGEVTIDRLP